MAHHPGRNDACPCGSGKKYKKCCELKQQNHRGNNLLLIVVGLADGGRRRRRASPLLPPSADMSGGRKASGRLSTGTITKLGLTARPAIRRIVSMSRAARAPLSTAPFM